MKLLILLSILILTQAREDPVKRVLTFIELELIVFPIVLAIVVLGMWKIHLIKNMWKPVENCSQELKPLVREPECEP
ncbi:unnamed protein product [Blepharisma stoltei]|uniref:Uncharacterized protein n=1 Tax=Blepharisma stoltei TaxID=1481888 RepID=A0AAU9IGS8_9CILI|nr:unnamed protein product [Blepharisma stoltei]